MSPTHFICFMLFLTTCNGIKCVDEIQMQLSTSEIASIGMETIFGDLKTSNNKKCQVLMEFDSIAQKFTINFGQSLEVPRLRSVENTFIQINTSIVPGHSETNMKQTSIKTIVHFVCYSNNQCDRQLVLEHIKWLITTNYKNLESTIRPLMLIQGNKKNECVVGNGNTVQQCDTTACSWYYSMNTEQSEGKCENAYSPTLPILELTTGIRMFEKHKTSEENEVKPIRAIFKHESSIKFLCELNNCNNQKVGELIKEAVSKENNIWTMHNIHRTARR